MLRHTEFYQFPRMEFGTETSPNELHLGIRDSLLDAGAKVFDEVLPTPVTNWTMTPVDYVGMHVGCEADYVAFEGSISARKGKPLPSKFWLIVVIGVITIIIGVGLLILLGCWIYRTWINKYANGIIITRYEGIYKRVASTAEDTSKKWQFKSEVMMSYNVEVPPFGKALGPEVVQPIFQRAQKTIYGYVKQGVFVERTLPQMVEIRASAYEGRFPVNYADDRET